MSLLQTLKAEDRQHPGRLWGEYADAVETIIKFAEASREAYKDTERFTTRDANTFLTIRVPKALLNRIKELGE